MHMSKWGLSCYLCIVHMIWHVAVYIIYKNLPICLVLISKKKLQLRKYMYKKAAIRVYMDIFK